MTLKICNRNVSSAFFREFKFLLVTDRKMIIVNIACYCYAERKGLLYFSECS